MRYLLIMTMFLFACGGTPYKRIAIGYRVVNSSAKITEGFDQSVGVWAKNLDTECTKKHQAKTADYAKCVDPALKFLRTWTGKTKGVDSGKGILPSIQAAQKAARLSLDAAYEYVKANESKCKDGCKEKTDAWKALLKPGVCALVTVVDQAVKLGAYKVTQDTYYKLVKGFADVWCGG